MEDVRCGVKIITLSRLSVLTFFSACCGRVVVAAAASVGGPGECHRSSTMTLLGHLLVCIGWFEIVASQLWVCGFSVNV